MSERDPHASLFDVVTAIDECLSFVEELDRQAFLNDRGRQLIVERELITVGEALASLRRSRPDLAQRIPHLADIVGMRNILVHEYGKVDVRLVWRVVDDHLGTLRATAAELLRELGA